MKALSIRQPWAWLIVNGFKNIENRTWKTNFRGQLLIHAGKAIDRAGYEYVRQHHPNIPLPSLEEFEVGGIVGRCHVDDCVERSDSPWFFGPVGFTLSDASPLPFQAMPGKLGFFTAERTA